jgi:hypothetical protein
MNVFYQMGPEIFRKANGENALNPTTTMTNPSVSYANMDFIFLSSIAGASVKSIIISYDIACQWSRNFVTRMADIRQRHGCG